MSPTKKTQSKTLKKSEVEDFLYF